MKKKWDEGRGNILVIRKFVEIFLGCVNCNASDDLAIGIGRVRRTCPTTLLILQQTWSHIVNDDDGVVQQFGGVVSTR